MINISKNQFAVFLKDLAIKKLVKSILACFVLGLFFLTGFLTGIACHKESPPSTKDLATSPSPVGTLPKEKKIKPATAIIPSGTPGWSTYYNYKYDYAVDIPTGKSWNYEQFGEYNGLSLQYKEWDMLLIAAKNTLPALAPLPFKEYVRIAGRHEGTEQDYLISLTPFVSNLDIQGFRAAWGSNTPQGHPWVGCSYSPENKQHEVFFYFPPSVQGAIATEGGAKIKKIKIKPCLGKKPEMDFLLLQIIQSFRYLSEGE